jgi:hypothetical protein
VEWALLHAPWELLADKRAYLASDALLQFSPQRRLGLIRGPAPSDDYRLGLAFMAAAPQGVSELDYEAEEAAILDAVGNTNLDLVVDESGEADALLQRAQASGPANDPVSAGYLAFERGKRLMQRGDLDGAEQAFIEAAHHAETAGLDSSVAVARG